MQGTGMSITGYDARALRCGINVGNGSAKRLAFFGRKITFFPERYAPKERRRAPRTSPRALFPYPAGARLWFRYRAPSGLSLAFTFFHTTTLKARTPVFPTPLTNLRPSACTLRRWRCRSLCLWQRPRALAPLLPHLLPPPPPPWLPPANLHPRRSVTGNACAAGRLPDAVRSWWW